MQLDMNVLASTIPYIGLIVGIVIGIIRQRRAINNNQVLATFKLWLGLHLSCFLVRALFVHVGWDMVMLNLIIREVLFVFRGYIWGRIGYFLFNAYCIKK